MKILSFFVVSFFTIYIIYGLAISQVNIKLPEKHDQQLINKNFDYKGVINVHSQEGDGEGTVSEILKAAYEANLDFIIFTETSSFDIQVSNDRYEENLLVLNGREYSYLKSRLILIDPDFDYSQIKNAGDAHLFLSDYLEQNRQGFVLLKHPTKSGYEWEGEFAKGIDAIEIISLRSHWRESWDLSKWNFITSLMAYPFNPEYAFFNIYQVPKKNLKLWNQIAKQRPIVGLIGSDAKSKLKIFRNTFARFPSYKQLFQLSSNHLILNSELTGQLKSDSKKIFTALTEGHFYFSLDFLGEPKGFNFFAKNKKGNVLPMGSTIPFKTNTTEICFTKPDSDLKNATAEIFHNGKLVFKSKESKCFKITERGNYNLLYNLKVKRLWPFKSRTIPWIYSNFIYVK
jgi:hypothetical protein